MFFVRINHHFVNAFLLQEDNPMSDKKHQKNQYAVGPIGAVATVPAEFLSSAIYEIVQGAYHLGERVGRKLRRR